MTILQIPQIQSASIIMMSFFSLSALISIIGFLRGRSASNSKFLQSFFIETFCISSLEISIGVLVYLNPNQTSLKLEFIQRCINSFSLVFQFALILTIAYGWKVACWKIQESTYSNFSSIRMQRTAYIIIVISLFCMQLIANISLLVYLSITGKTYELIINVLDMVLQILILFSCIFQLVQAIKLSNLLSTYQILFGVKTKRFSFYSIYISIFILNMSRCIIQISSLSYYFIEGKVPIVILQNLLTYYISYICLQFIPMTMYLMVIKVSGGGPGRQRAISSNSTHRSSIITQMVDRLSLNL